MLALFVGSVASSVLEVNPLSAFAGIMGFALVAAAGMYLMGGQGVRGLTMAVTLFTPCDGTVPSVTPAGECLEEGSGIVGLLLIKKGFNISTVITDDTTYGTAKTAKDIIVVKDLEAYWPSTTQNTIPGFRGRIEKHGNINYELAFKHEGVDNNMAFWNYINNNRNYGVAIITEEYKAFTCLERVSGEPVMASFFAAPSSEQEYGKNRFIEGVVKWKHKDLPYHLDLLTRTILEADFQS